MTSTLRNSIFTMALGAATLVSATTAFGAPASKAVTGSIISVDRAAHTLVVRDNATNATFRVAIPKGAQVAVAPLSSRASGLDFEHVLVGMQYRGIR